MSRSHVFIEGLASRFFREELSVHEFLFGLLSEIVNELSELPALGRNGALSAVGYTLFSRALIDRGVREIDIEFPDTFKKISDALEHHGISFAYVPSVVLTEVYDRLISGHCTPRFIAEYMYDQAFPGITSSQPDRAHILDPCAGTGTFLVLALKKLVAERWKVTGVRPDSKEIWQILRDQIRGYDTNVHALKLAETCLYLTAIELGATTEELGFQPLIGKVLFPVVEGSSFFGTKDHDERFDLVISTPPWEPWKGDGSNSLNKQASDIIRQIAFRRDPAAHATYTQNYVNANKNPDLPLMWRTMEWAKPNGIIALSMHARILFSDSDALLKNRHALFNTLRITGILDGNALHMANGWTGHPAPFCLVFAINRIPTGNDIFHLVSPKMGPSNMHRMTIDYSNAHPVQLSVLRKRPSLFKTLSRGDVFGAEIMNRIDGIKTVPVRSYLSKMGLHHGFGFHLPKGDERGDERYPAHEFFLKPLLNNITTPSFNRDRSRRHALYSTVTCANLMTPRSSRGRSW